MKEHIIKREEFNYDSFRALIYNEIYLNNPDLLTSQKTIDVKMSIPGAEIINDLILEKIRGTGFPINIGDSPFAEEENYKLPFLANLNFQADDTNQDTSEFVINNKFKIIITDTDTNDNNDNEDK